MTPIVHFDDTRSRHIDAGHIRGDWRDLGDATGSVTIGLNLIDIDADGFSTPVHVHGAEEEIFYVLAGDGLLWQGGATHQIGIGDCIVHTAGGEPHTLRAGSIGLSVLAFGERSDAAACYLPRANVAWLAPTWVEAGGAHPFKREAAAGAPDCPDPTERPANVINLADAPLGHGGTTRLLGRGGGSKRSGLNHVTLPAGGGGAPPHCHSVEDELFVILAGDAAFMLGDETHMVRVGSVVSRPAGTGVAHALRAGAEGSSYLVYGTRSSADAVFYPDTGLVRLRGLGVSIRAEPR